MTLILNVDDNTANCYVKSRVLRAAGFDVVEASTGEKAFEFATQRKPALVLLDIRLPDISGIEVCRRLRADPRTRRIPIIHISATHITPQDEATSLSAGADIYLAEPVGSQELSSAVRALLRLRSTERGLEATEERLRLATEGAGIATWDIDLSSGAAVWSSQFSSMLGYAGEPDAPTLDTWLARVHHGDRDALRVAFHAAGSGERPFAQEYRTLADEGAVRWISAFGRLHVDEEGTSRRLIGVAIDVTARKEAELEREALLARARSAQRVAEDAVRMKDEFLAMLSHELRTPMSAMLGWLHMLKTGRLAPEQERQALETIDRNARVQTQLVNDLLDVSRIVTGKMDLESSPIALDRALEAAIESARLAGAARSIELVPHFERGPWLVRGNAERVQQIFSNLLSNAIKFSPPGRRVDIRMERSGAAEARVSVIDQGEGIAPEVLPHVFDRFRQADSSRRRRHGGLGLGLAIVRSLVELHGGRVEASSPGAGQGATFTVSFPLLESAHPPEQAPAQSMDTRLSGIRVLVVDDDESNLQMIAQMLRLGDASVMTSPGAASALLVAQGWKPDVLVLDIGMPDMDGYELLPELRAALGATPGRLPAIALSGFAAKEDVQRALDAGFQAHLAKPFEMTQLCLLIARLAGSRPPAGLPWAASPS